MKKLLFFLLGIILLPTLALAGPASPGVITDKQPDGSVIEYYLKGDEKMHWMESLDGYTLLVNDSGYIVYAIQDVKKDLVPSEIIYKNIPTTKSADSRISSLPKKMFYSESQINQMYKIWEIEKTQSRIKSSSYSQYSGKIRVLCILVDFEDRPFSIEDPKAKFDMLFNQRQYIGSIDNPAYGSIRDYFLETSYGKVDIQFDFIGPYRAGKMSEYKGSGVYKNTNLNKLGKWLIQNKINNELNLDLSLYSNSSSTINRAHIIFAGEDQANAGLANGFAWAHQFGFGMGSSTEPGKPWDYQCVSNVDGKTYTFKKYSCSAELTHNWRNKKEKYISTIGTPAHELAHLLFESKDYYDAYGVYKGTGQWDLMGGGSHNHLTNNFHTKVIYGNCPAHMNMYDKIRLGWIEPKILNSTGDHSLINSAENPIAYIYQKGTTYSTFTSIDDIQGEFYILENKQKKGFDRALLNNSEYNEPYFQGGLLIYRVHPDIKNTTNPNDSYPQQLYPICASSTDAFPSQNMSSYGNINGVDCVFGNSYNKFTDEGTPSAKTILSYIGGSAATSVNTEKPITEITNQNEIITFKFKNPNLPIEKYHPNDKKVLRHLIRSIDDITLLGLQPSDTINWENSEEWLTKPTSYISVKWNEMPIRRITHIGCSYIDIESLDLSPLSYLKSSIIISCEQLKDLNLKNTTLEFLQIKMSRNVYSITGLKYSKDLFDLCIDDSQIKSIDLSTHEKLKYLRLFNNNKLTDIILPDNFNNTAFPLCDINSNSLRFSTLPDFSLYPNITFEYNTQNIDGDVVSGSVDLSSEYNIRGTISNYSWFYLVYKGSVEFIPFTPQTSNNGKFTFSPDMVGKDIICRITNEEYPDLTLKYKASLINSSSNISDPNLMTTSLYPSLLSPYQTMNIDFNEYASNAKIQIFDLNSGAKTADYSSINGLSINISAPQKSGTYIVRIITQSKMESHKIIVK